MEYAFSRSERGSRRSLGGVDDDEEEALRWAALEKLPTYDQLRTSILKSYMESENEKQQSRLVHKEVDVRKLSVEDRQAFIEQTFKVVEEDNEKLLRKFRSRMERVGIQLPRVEVRFEHLTIEAKCYVGTRALPTLVNTARNIAESALAMLGIRLTKRTTLTILKDASGVIKPSRYVVHGSLLNMTHVGPMSSSYDPDDAFVRSSILREDNPFAGTCRKARHKLEVFTWKVQGEVTYNGYRLSEFVPQKTAAYVSQNDVHIRQMTVKETLDFSARCQGVGSRYGVLIAHAGASNLEHSSVLNEFYHHIVSDPDHYRQQNPAATFPRLTEFLLIAELLAELVRREKAAGIHPEADVDLFMKLMGDIACIFRPQQWKELKAACKQTTF
ncbi:transcription factor [Asimina triloba]